MITYSNLGRMGWLGNTLFQIATTVIHSKRVGTTAAFPAWMYQNGFKHPLQLISRFPEERFSERGFHYEPIPLKDNIDLYGHFQSYRYFDDYYDDVIKLFEIKESIVEKIENNMQFLRDYNCCSLHVRRGDYAKYPDHHPMLPLSYYEEATSKFSKDTLFVVFSNEINWCKENLSKLNRKFIFIDYTNQPIELCIMTKCHDHIISNSSFSWWGSYLCDNKDKKTIAPSTWFGVAYKDWDTKDLLPNSWEILICKK